MSPESDGVKQKYIHAGGNVIGHQNNYYHGAPPQVVDTLPAYPVGLAGREADLAELLETLNPTVPAGSGAVIAAIAGMGGIGKTALATAAGHLARERGWFSTTLFLPLHGYSPEVAPVAPSQALEALLRALGVAPVHIPPTLDERVALYRSRLSEIAEERGGPVLVVADNAAEASQVEPLLPGPSRHRLLVTSRESLPFLHNVHQLDLDVLSPDAAVKLLSTSLITARPKDARVSEIDELRRVAEFCGFLPLALRICAARLVRSQRQTPARLADQLADSTPRLEQLDLGDGRPSLAAIFDLSLKRLSGREIEVFLLLGLNPGPDISDSAAAELANMNIEEVSEILDDLTAAHLLNYAPVTGRWAMHDLLAEHARNRVGELEGDPQQARKRLLKFFEGMVTAANARLQSLPGDDLAGMFGDTAQAISWLDAERVNLVAAVYMARSTGNFDVVTRISQDLVYYLDLRSHFEDWVGLTSVCLDMAEKEGDRFQAAIAADNLGVALQQMGRFSDSMRYHELALAFFQESDDFGREAITWSNIGLALIEAGDAESAVRAQERACFLHQSVGDQRKEASAWNNLGLVLQRLMKFEDSIEAHARARDLYREVGDRDREPRALMNLGNALMSVGRIEEALQSFMMTREVTQGIGDNRREAMALDSIGLALQRLGRADDAIESHREARDMFVRVNNLAAEAKSWYFRATAQVLSGQAEEARDSLIRARCIFQEIGDRYGEASASAQLVFAFARSGQPQEARDSCAHAQEFVRESSDPRIKSDILKSLAAGLAELGKPEQAIELLNEVVQILDIAGAVYLKKEAVKVLKGLQAGLHES